MNSLLFANCFQKIGIFLICCFCNFSVFSQMTFEKTYLEQQQLKGKVKRIEIYRTFFEESLEKNGRFYISDAIKLDKKGRLVDQISFLGGITEKYYLRNFYKYYPNKKKIESVTYKSALTNNSFVSEKRDKNFDFTKKVLKELKTFPYQKSTTYFADNGNLSEFRNYLIDGKDEIPIQFERFEEIKDENGKIIKSVSYESVQKLTTVFLHFYKEKNSLEIIRFENQKPISKLIYAFDNQNRIISVDNFSLMSDENNEIINEKIVSKTQNEWENGFEKSTWIIFDSEENYKLKKVSIRSGAIIISSKEFIYEKNLPEPSWYLTKEVFDKFPRYDKYGNWIVRETFQKQSPNFIEEQVSKEERIFTYY